MNVKALIPLIAGLGIGGLALKLGLDTLKTAKGAQREVKKVQVWAASRDILRGETISDDMIKSLHFPETLVPKGAIQEKEVVVGRVPGLDVLQDLPILEHALLPPGEFARLKVKPGYRAVSVKIDEGSGVDYHLEPGCFVDVIGSFRVRGDGGRQETVAKTIIQNAEVAAVGQRLNPSSGKDEEEESAKGQQRKVRAVTLFVKPEDVPKLLVTEQEGRIKLCLRSDVDPESKKEPPPVTGADLWGNERPEPPKQEPDAMAEWLKLWADSQATQVEPEPVDETWVVSVHRGNEVEEQVTFENRDSWKRVETKSENARGGGRVTQLTQPAGPAGYRQGAAPPMVPDVLARGPSALGSGMTPPAAAPTDGSFLSNTWESLKAKLYGPSAGPASPAASDTDARDVRDTDENQVPEEPTE